MRSAVACLLVTFACVGEAEVVSFAEFEHAMLRERTRSGLDEARKQGRLGGRRHKLRPDQQEEIVSLVHTGQKTAAAAARRVQRPSRDRIASFAAQQNSLTVFCVPLLPKPQLADLNTSV